MDTDKIIAIKARLLATPSQLPRNATADDYIEAMYANLRAARLSGKSWKQIADDFRPDVQLSPDSLRQAFERRRQKLEGKTRKKPKPSPVKKRSEQSVATAPATAVRPKVDLGAFAVARDNLSDFGSLL